MNVAVRGRSYDEKAPRSYDWPPKARLRCAKLRGNRPGPGQHRCAALEEGRGRRLKRRPRPPGESPQSRTADFRERAWCATRKCAWRTLALVAPCPPVEPVAPVAPVAPIAAGAPG